MFIAATYRVCGIFLALDGGSAAHPAHVLAVDASDGCELARGGLQSSTASSEHHDSHVWLRYSYDDGHCDRESVKEQFVCKRRVLIG